jgi:cell division protein FtsB
MDLVIKRDGGLTVSCHFVFHLVIIALKAAGTSGVTGTMFAESLRTLWAGTRRRVKSAAMPAFLLTLTGIFAWQATQGDHGLIMREQRKTQLAQAEANLAAAKAERDNWERKVSGLTPSHLDKDALDQRARELLNLADPSEIVVQYGPKDKLF